MNTRKLYTNIKDRGISVLTITRMLKEANVKNSRGDYFPQRTIQDYFDKNFDSNNGSAQDDMDLLKNKVNIIILSYDQTILKLK